MATMNLLCAICQDALEPSNDIFVTPCGHVFHFPCLIQWLEKAQNCPQCRQKCRRDSITRIYFNFSNTEAIKEDSYTLQQRVDSLMFQIKLKETDLKNIKTENATLKKQNSGLREEVKKNESEVKHKNSTILALNHQITFLKENAEELNKIKAENEKLQTTLSSYDDVKILMYSTADEVDKMLVQKSDVATLSTYVSILKRELNSGLEKRKKFRCTIKDLQHELQTVKMSRESLTETFNRRLEILEEELILCKSENEELEKQLLKLKSKESSDQNVQEELPEFTSPVFNSRKREMKDDIDIDNVSTKKSKLKVPSLLEDSVMIVSTDLKKTKGNEENSPYLPTKSKSILALKERAQHSRFAFEPKKSLSLKKSDSSSKTVVNKDSSITFDGFGGHSRVEIFPKSSPSKLKRPATDSTKTKKIKLDRATNKQLDDFVINLT